MSSEGHDCQLCNYTATKVNVLQRHYELEHFGDEESAPASNDQENSPARPPSPAVSSAERMRVHFGEAVMTLSYLLMEEVDYGLVWRFSPQTTEAEIDAFINKYARELRPEIRTLANFLSFMKSNTSLHRVYDEMSSMNYYQQRFRPLVRDEVSSDEDMEQEDEGMDEALDDDAYSDLSSVPSLDEDEGDDVQSWEDLVDDPDRDHNWDKEYDYGNEEDYERLRAHEREVEHQLSLGGERQSAFQRQGSYAEQCSAYEAKCQLAYDEDQRRIGMGILATFIDDARKARDRAGENREAYLKKGEWCYQDTSTWGDAYRPEPDYEPPVVDKESDDEDEDDDLIDGLYVRGT